MATSASSPLISPSSDKLFWSSLHERVETILETRNSDHLPPSSISPTKNDEGLLNLARNQSKDDSTLLLRGFDSIASSLSVLTANLQNALQGARELGKPSTFTEVMYSSTSDADEERKGVKRKLDDDQDCCRNEGEASEISENKKKQKPHAEMMNLKKVKNLAVAMATKSVSLVRELKSVKSDMCFLQERYALLEEENQRLRDGFGGKGVRTDDDDLVRLQLEVLLAEKSRLATEKANLTRENQCLRQLVEYHQFASEDLSASYEKAIIEGLCLDFDSPNAQEKSNHEDTSFADSEGTSEQILYDLSR